ncbi:hypothetical protein OAW65_01930 [Candidatus Pelagibacter sp.]|nr:hypothetical protein [Candidatus Pelagibacter sp.]
MLKKILIIFSLILLTSCEYKPIYSSANKSNYKIIVTELTGDKKLNKFIVENLTRNSEKDSNQIINIKINTTYNKSILAKDSSGNATDYQANALTTFLIDRNLVTKQFDINEKFNFQKMSDKYEEKSYEENIKKNLAKSISQKLILRLSIPQ